MDILPFSQKLAQEYFSSIDQFPIDLDEAWVWLGYAKKQNAKDALIEYFEDKQDFLRCGVKSSLGGRPSEQIKLSVNCFKEMAMVAKTEQGKQVRKYFLECERVAKTLLAQPQLPPSDIRVTSLVTGLQALGIQLDNPRFQQELQDIALDILGIGQKQLPETKQTWLGVAERAEQLGYSVAFVCRHRSQLGKYVKACGLDSKQEKRLCNGTQRDINLYLLCTELDKAIIKPRGMWETQSL